MPFYQHCLQGGLTAVDIALQKGSEAMVAALLDWHPLPIPFNNCMFIVFSKVKCSVPEAMFVFTDEGNH